MTIVVVFMMLLAGEADVVEGVKEDTSKQDTLKDEPQLKENTLKEAKVAPKKEAAEQGGGGGEASSGEDEKKIEEETSNSKAGGDDDGGNKESADANGGDEGQSGTELENSDSPASGKDNGEAASSFDPSSSASSSSPPLDNQEIPPPGKPKPTESGENNQKEDSGSGKVAAHDEPKIAKLEESSNGEGKEAASEEAAGKGANPDPVKEEAGDGDISKKEENAMDVDAPEVKEESKVDTPLETSFEKQMGSGAADPAQSNFFSYFIVLAIITIIAYLVFHNKKKILGLIVEGRSGRQAGRRRSGGREYRKLDSNVEDMMETGRETSMRQVIY